MSHSFLLEGHAKCAAYKHDPIQTSENYWYGTGGSPCAELNAVTSNHLHKMCPTILTQTDSIPQGEAYSQNKTINPINTTFWYASCFLICLVPVIRTLTKADRLFAALVEDYAKPGGRARFERQPILDDPHFHHFFCYTAYHYHTMLLSYIVL